MRKSYVVMVDSEDGKRTVISGFCNSKEEAESSAKTAINDGRDVYIYGLLPYKTKVNKVTIEETP